MYIRGALKIGLVAPMKPFHPYLVDDLAPLLDLHYLRISPWLWFRSASTSAVRTVWGRGTQLGPVWQDGIRYWVDTPGDGRALATDEQLTPQDSSFD